MVPVGVRYGALVAKLAVDGVGVLDELGVEVIEVGCPIGHWGSVHGGSGFVVESDGVFGAVRRGELRRGFAAGTEVAGGGGGGVAEVVDVEQIGGERRGSGCDPGSDRCRR